MPRTGTKAKTIGELLKRVEDENKEGSDNESIITKKPGSQFPKLKTRYLSMRGYVILKKELPEKYHDSLKDTATAKIHDQFTDMVKTFPVYLENDNKFYLPRFLALDLLGEPTKKSKIPDGTDLSLNFNGKPQKAQLPAIEAMRKAFNEKGGGFLNLRCGGGKTVIALYATYMLQKKTLVIVHKDFLINQWKERIAQFLPDARIGLIKGKKLEVEDKDIVLATIQSLSMKKYEGDVFEGFGLMILDECHRMPSEVFSRALQKISTKYILGLSATTTRKDGLMKQLKWFIGPIFFSNIKDEIRQTNSKAGQTSTPNQNIFKIMIESYKIVSDNTEYCDTPTLFNGKPNSAQMVNNVTSYAQRNKLILKLIRHLRDEKYNKNYSKSHFKLTKQNKKRQIIILSDRLNQLAFLQEKIEELGLCSVGKYVGGMKQKALKESEDKDVILATYAMAREGLDIKSLNTLILASPVSDVEQSVGRILRSRQQCVEEDLVPIHYPKVLDVVDNFSIFIAQSKKRETYYTRERAYMTRFKVTDINNKLSIDKTDDEYQLGGTRGRSKNPANSKNTFGKTKPLSQNLAKLAHISNPVDFNRSVFSDDEDE